MPWREMSPMEERVEFVREIDSGLFTDDGARGAVRNHPEDGLQVAGAVRGRGSARVAGSLAPPAPESAGHRAPAVGNAHTVAAAASALGTEETAGGGACAAIATGRVAVRHRRCRTHLKARGLIGARRQRRRPLGQTRRPARRSPRANEVWTTDFKGEFLTGDRRYCYPFTLRDGYSRFVLRCDALTAHTLAVTRPASNARSPSTGCPTGSAVTTARPLADRAWAGCRPWRCGGSDSASARNGSRRGIPSRTARTNSFTPCSKTHTTRPPAATARAQQRRFTRFCAEYNHERPHEALGQAVPASQYQPSARSLPRRLPPLDYPGHAEIRRVDQNGYVSWQGAPLFVSAALAQEPIAFEEVDDGIWTVHFATLALARVRCTVSHASSDHIADQRGRSASSAGSAPALKHEER